MERTAQIAIFLKLAQANYEKPGWDTFTECYDADDISRFFEPTVIPGHETAPENILDTEAKIYSLMTDLASVWDDRQADGRQYREDADERNERENDQFDLDREGV